MNKFLDYCQEQLTQFYNQEISLDDAFRYIEDYAQDNYIG